jgi:acetyl esterase
MLMRFDGRTLRRRALAAVALLWTAFCLFWALWIVLPAPTLTLWTLSVLVAEFALVLVAFAGAGLTLAALCWRVGSRRAAVLALVFGMAAVVLSVLPTAQAWRTARAEDVRLSVRQYFAGLSVIPERSPTETRVYSRPEGRELKLDVYEPGGGAKGAARTASRPAVIMVHGGSWEMGERSDTPRWHGWLADNGYVVFAIDYRLAPPPRWQDAPGDVKCAIGWVKRNADRYGVDPERVALMGNSAGGHLALLAAYAEDHPRLPPSCEVSESRVAAVVAFYPPTDLAGFCTDPPPDGLPRWYPDLDCQGVLRRFTGATLSTDPDRYRLASPISHVDAGDPPTFLVHGGRDSLVAPGQSRLLAQRLEEAGVPHRLLELPHAQHFFDLSWGGWGSQITRAKLEQFLEEYLNTPMVRRR